MAEIDLLPVHRQVDFRLFLKDCYLCTWQLLFLGQAHNDIDQWKSLDMQDERLLLWQKLMMKRSKLFDLVRKRCAYLEQLVCRDQWEGLAKPSDYLQELGYYYYKNVHCVKEPPHLEVDLKTQLTQLIYRLWPAAIISEESNVLHVASSIDLLLFTLSSKDVERQPATDKPAVRLMQLMLHYWASFKTMYSAMHDQYEKLRAEKNN